jgi:hypothetical protein
MLKVSNFQALLAELNMHVSSKLVKTVVLFNSPSICHIWLSVLYMKFMKCDSEIVKPM